jgi:hypothetical protein
MNKPNQKAARLRVNWKDAAGDGCSPRNHTAKATNQARAPAARHHQAEKPNEK